MTNLPRGRNLEDLRAFLDVLRQEQEIVEVAAPVDPDLEAAEIHRRVIAAGGPALMFTNVKGHDWPVVTNMFGTVRRVELAFGPRPEALTQQLVGLVHELVPPTLNKLWQQRQMLGALLRVGRRVQGSGPVTEVVDGPPRLTRLPLLRTWPEDGGPFLTLPLVYTEHPGGLGHNLAIYRVQRYSDDHVGLHMQIHKGGGFHLAAHEELNQPMPVNIHAGSSPALILSAAAPLPENVGELLLASLVQGRKLRMARNPLGPLPVLADCEFVLVGEVQPGARHPEGPFGDHYGYYSLQHDYPLVAVKGLLRRRDPILNATVVGKPRQEDFYLGDYLQQLLAPFIRLAMPQVKQLWAYGETGYHSLAAAVVRERYRREAMQAAFRILGEGQLSLTKFLLVIDCDVDLRDFKQTLEHVLSRARFETDLFVFGNLSMDTLDYTGPDVNEGSKGVLLGLGEPVRDLPREFAGSLPAGFSNPVPFCGGCLVVDGPTYEQEADAAARLVQANADADANANALDSWPLVVLVDDARTAARSSINFLWTTFTRFEPAADIHARQLKVVRHQPIYTPPIVIDARFKPTYPKELHCDEATAQLVSQRWSEYFPSTSVEMGDSDRAHLD
ncbi:MAG: UbiD family decarboxylase [Planctomycetota bacterium]|jgi:UbiD family decarboxylase